jgi:hypothetical protein
MGFLCLGLYNVGESAGRYHDLARTADQRLCLEHMTASAGGVGWSPAGCGASFVRDVVHNQTAATEPLTDVEAPRLDTA